MIIITTWGFNSYKGQTSTINTSVQTWTDSAMQRQPVVSRDLDHQKGCL
jgi:hypothetical protein